MNARLALTSALVVLALGGCASSANALPPCQSNDECGGLLCFAEGCGDPGKGIVVEVEGGTQSGLYARDFPLASVNAVQDFSLREVLSINGQFLRSVSSANPLERVSYAAPVGVRAVGQSSLLPGITRTFDAHFANPERGFFDMKLGAGTFELTATADDRTVPPFFTTAVVDPSGVVPSVTVAFPAVDGAPALSGQLIRYFNSRLLPPEPELIATPFLKAGVDVPAVEVQLLDSTTGQALSQRFPISSTTGEFALIVSPEARLRSSLVLLAAPTEPGVPIPTKRFVLSNPLPTSVPLEFGDYGDAAEIKGTVVDSQGVPVVGAQVVLAGTVQGDGTFRSKIVETNAAGEFRVLALPSKGDGNFEVTIAPPHGSRAAYTRAGAAVKVTNGVGELKPARFELHDRLITHGSVTRPGTGNAAAGVSVVAVMQAETGSTLPLPVEQAEAVTDADGHFTLSLDPGKWRFEYFPSDLQPMASRLVTVKPVLDGAGRELPELTLPEVQLSFGRTVSGLVTGTMGTKTDALVPFSRVRFFRVTSVEGKPTSVLLATTTADERGRYSVVLPTVATQQ